MLKDHMTFWVRGAKHYTEMREDGQPWQQWKQLPLEKYGKLVDVSRI
jgi:hypothetical protein